MEVWGAVYHLHLALARDRCPIASWMFINSTTRARSDGPSRRIYEHPTLSRIAGNVQRFPLFGKELDESGA